MVSNFYSNQSYLSYDQLLFYNRLIFASSSVAVGIVPLFFRSFWKTEKLVSGWRSYLVYYICALFLVSFTPFIAKGVVTGGPIVEVVFGPLAIFYFGGLLFFIGLSMYELRLAATKLQRRARNQLKIIGITTAIALVLSMITNGILPFTIAYYEASLFGPLFYFIMIFGFAFTIARMQLFDLRLTLVRYLAYLFSLLSVAITFVCIVVFIVSEISGITYTNLELVVLILLSVLMLAGFHLVRRFFDFISYKLFYKKAFNLNETLEEFADIFVRETETEPILQSVFKLLNERISLTQITYYELKGGVYALRFTSEGSSPLTTTSPTLNKIKKTNIRVYVSDIDSDQLAHRVKRSSIEAAVRLTTTTDDLGYLLLGAKNSGNAYTIDDIDLLQSLSKNLSIALENAKRLEEISSFSKKLETEIKKATSELQSTNKKLQDLNSMKNDFISATTHQLRPQLAASKGFLELILAAPARLGQEVKSNIELSIKSIDKMSRVVIGILEPSLYSDEKPRLLKKEISMNNLLAQELEAVARSVASKDMKIVLHVPKENIKVLADKEKIGEVVYNILDNAVKYGDKGSEITIKLKKNLSSIDFSVENKGEPLATSTEDSIFTKFYRSESATRKNPAGTGVGLYVVKMFVEAHGGKVHAHADKLGEGSVVGFTLPSETE